MVASARERLTAGSHGPAEPQAPDPRAAVPLWILTVLGVMFFLRETRDLCVPIALALLASYALYPPVTQLVRLRLPRAISAAVVVGGLVGLLAWAASALGDDFAEGIRTLPEQIRQARSSAEASLQGGVFSSLREAAIAIRGAEPQPADTAESTPSPTPIARYLWQSSSGLLAIAGQATMFVFLLYFFLLGADQWRARIVEVSGTALSSRRTASEVLDEINWQVRRFLLVRVFTAAVVTVATWIVLVTVGAPSPVFWAIASGLLNWIPYAGPLIVSAGLAIVGLVAGGVAMAAQLAGAALIITTLEGWLITPALLGRVAQVNTQTVLLSLLIWSWAWGVWGTVLAVPLTMMIKVVSDHVERLHWVSRLLTNEPANDTPFMKKE